MLDTTEPTGTPELLSVVPIPQINIARLEKEFSAAGLPIINVRISKDLSIDYDWMRTPTEQEFWSAAQIIEDHAYDPDDTTDADRVVLTDVSEQQFTELPDWARTMTAGEAITFINGQIWSGMTEAQVDAWIDSKIGNVSGSTVAQVVSSVNTQLGNVRAALKQIASVVITIRSLFLVLVKLIVCVRDLIIRR